LEGLLALNLQDLFNNVNIHLASSASQRQTLYPDPIGHDAPSQPPVPFNPLPTPFVDTPFVNLPNTVNSNQVPFPSRHQTLYPDPAGQHASSQPPVPLNPLPTPFVDGDTGTTPPTTLPDHHPPASPSPSLEDIIKSIPGLSNKRPQMPNVEYEANLDDLEARCKAQGGDPDAIARLRGIFARGVSNDALKRTRRKKGAPLSMTDGFRQLVGQRSCPTGNGAHITLYWCLLCRFGLRAAYQQDKDVLPHLRRKHFGLLNPKKAKENDGKS
jgi:hypothetical protein